jgi:hypothetical protein
VRGAAQKYLQHYVPPIVKLENMGTDQRIDAIQYEVTADIGDIQPQATILYELNCSQKMARELSTDIVVNGKHGFRDKPSDWMYTPPEGNGTRLLQMLCPSR